MKGTLYYDHFFWFATTPIDCPLCGTHIPAETKHECSNPKPVELAPPAATPRRARRATVGAGTANRPSASSGKKGRP